MLGLETSLSVVQETMVDTGLLTWADVADRMSYAPARIGRVTDHGRPLEDGAPANVVLYDPSVRHVVEAADSVSLSRNTPYAGMGAPGPGRGDVPARPGHGPRRQARLTFLGRPPERVLQHPARRTTRGGPVDQDSPGPVGRVRIGP
jgi:hypothetical protein